MANDSISEPPWNKDYVGKVAGGVLPSCCRSIEMKCWCFNQSLFPSSIPSNPYEDSMQRSSMLCTSGNSKLRRDKDHLLSVIPNFWSITASFFVLHRRRHRKRRLHGRHFRSYGHLFAMSSKSLHFQKFQCVPFKRYLKLQLISKYHQVRFKFTAKQECLVDLCQRDRETVFT